MLQILPTLYILRDCMILQRESFEASYNLKWRKVAVTGCLKIKTACAGEMQPAKLKTKKKAGQRRQKQKLWDQCHWQWRTNKPGKNWAGSSSQEQQKEYSSVYTQHGVATKGKSMHYSVCIKQTNQTEHSQMLVPTCCKSVRLLPLCRMCI